MKKAIVFICVIAVAITINSCKPMMYYPCCDTGHAHWEGNKYDSKDSAAISARDHDNLIHSGVTTAGICNTR